MNGALTAASARLRDVTGFPKRPGRPRTNAIPRGNHIPAPAAQRENRNRPVTDSSLLPRELAELSSSEGVSRRNETLLPPRLLGARDGGAYLGVSAWALRQLIDDGHVRPVALPGIKRLLVDRADLDALIENAKTNGRHGLPMPSVIAR